MSTINPYETPQAALETANAIDSYDETSPFSPKGRFGRAAYVVYSFGFSFLIMIVVMTLIAIVANTADKGSGLISMMPVITLFMYVVLIPISFIFMIRRLHDLNWSGWLSLVSLVPLVNFAIAIPLLFFRGTEGSNRFGPPRRASRSHTYIAVVLVLVFFGGGILAAIAIPAYQDYAKRAQQAQMQMQK